MTSTNSTSAIIPDLLTLTAATVPNTQVLLSKATDIQRDSLSENGRISTSKLEENQTAAHGLSWLATYSQALTQMQAWAEKLQAD